MVLLIEMVSWVLLSPILLKKDSNLLIIIIIIIIIIILNILNMRIEFEIQGHKSTGDASLILWILLHSLSLL
jgi:hypothetical protein